MKTGFSKVCINPPYGYPIVGYYESRNVKGFHDNLYARAFALDDGEKKSVIIAVDICFLLNHLYEKIKKGICEVIDIESNAIFITCSHTHTGPLVGKDLGAETGATESYLQFLVERIRDAAIYAFSDLKESKFEVAEGVAEGISFVRRYRMKDGSVATNPGVNNENIDHPLGEPDESVKILKVVRDGGDDVLMINFGTHADSVGGEYISADYMGFTGSILEKAIPNTKCMFLLGAQGDVNHINVHPTEAESAISKIDFDSVPRSIELSEYMGRKLAGAVLPLVSITKEIKADKISYGFKKVMLPSHQENHRLEEAKRIYELHETGRSHELPYKEMALTTVVAEAKRIIKLENGPEAFPFYISAVRVGNLVFAGIGGEPFVEIGRRIKNASPFEETIVCCLTNSEGGYIPTKQSYDEGGYEARASALKPGGDDIIVEGVTELLNELK